MVQKLYFGENNAKSINFGPRSFISDKPSLLERVSFPLEATLFRRGHLQTTIIRIDKSRRNKSAKTFKP